MLAHKLNGSHGLVKPSSPCTINWGHPSSQGLVFYLPMLGGASRRGSAVDLVTGKRLSDNWTAMRFSVGWPGIGIDIQDGDNGGGNNYIRPPHTASPLNGCAQATVGGLVMAQNVSGSTGWGANLGGIPRFTFASNGNTNDYFRTDFITDSAYAIGPSGTFVAGTYYTIFSTWISGNYPKLLKGEWPHGRLAELSSYTLRGNGSGTISVATDELFKLPYAAPCRVFWVGYWNRALPLHEMQELHRAPWGLLIDPAPRVLYGAPSVGMSHLVGSGLAGDGRLAGHGLAGA